MPDDKDVKDTPNTPHTPVVPTKPTPPLTSTAAKPSQADAGTVHPARPNPTTNSGMQPAEQAGSVKDDPATPPQQKDTRPTAPPPSVSTTQKPNPAPVASRPTGGVFVGGPAKAMQPEPKQPPVTTADEVRGPAWNHRGTVTPDNFEDFIYIDKVAGNLPFRGVCLKCGWQSIQLTNQAAIDAVHRHLGRHVREAVA